MSPESIFLRGHLFQALEETLQAEREAAINEVRSGAVAANVAAELANGHASGVKYSPQAIDASTKMKVMAHFTSEKCFSEYRVVLEYVGGRCPSHMGKSLATSRNSRCLTTILRWRNRQKASWQMLLNRQTRRPIYQRLQCSIHRCFLEACT